MSRPDAGPKPSSGPVRGGEPSSGPVPGGEPSLVPGSGEIPPAEPAPPREPWAGWDPLLRVFGVAIATLAAVLSAFLEIILSPLRSGDVTAIWAGDPIGAAGGPRIGVAVVLAAVLNLGIAWFAYTTSGGRRWALVPPWAAWTLVMLFAAGVRTSEGDYLLGQDNWVALVMILAGSVTYAGYSYRMIMKRVPSR